MRLIYTIYNITMTTKPSVNSQREEEEGMGKGTCTMQTDLRWREQCQLSARVEEFTPLNADELVIWKDGKARGSASENC